MSFFSFDFIIGVIYHLVAILKISNHFLSFSPLQASVLGLGNVFQLSFFDLFLLGTDNKSTEGSDAYDVLLYYNIMH